MKNYADQGGCCCFPVKTNKKKKTKAIAGKQNANLQSYFWCVWSAPLCILYSEVFAKPVHILGISLFCQPICMICGREGPGVEIKVHLMSSLESHECKFPNHTQQYLFDSQRKHTYFRYTRDVLFDNVPKAICLAHRKSIYQEK